MHAHRHLMIKAILLSLFILLLLSGCQSTGNLPEVSLKPSDHSKTNPKPMENQNTLKVGISSVLSPRETLEDYHSFALYLEKKIGRPVEIVQRQTYQEINELVKKQDVDVAFICSGAYAIGKENDDLELLAVPKVKGKTTYQSFIIVNAASPIYKFKELKGQVFGFTDPISFSGTIAPSYMVSQFQSTPKDFFSRVVYTYSHDNSIRAVLDNVVAAAAVDSLVYHNAIAKDPSLSTKLRIIDESLEVGSPPVVVNRKIDPNLKMVLQEALLEADIDSLGQQALKALSYDGIVLPDEKAYDSIQKMIEAMPAFKME